jgi:hypothetical protein
VEHSRSHSFRFPGIDWPLQDLDPGGQLALDLPQDLKGLIGAATNRSPAEYERRWAWIFPAWFLYFELEVVKDV